MKTINHFRQYLPAVIFSTILIVSILEVSAQNHGNKWKKGNGHERNEYKESDHDKNSTAYYYKNDDREDNHENKSWKSREYHRGYRPEYSVRHKHYESDYYEHPRYGRVYHRFDDDAVVFHNDRNDYYYYGNHFYNYRRGVGYCVIEPPRHVYFRQLPIECERVYLNGNIFFRNGDVFFQLSPRGYSIVPSPVQIRITARF